MKDVFYSVRLTPGPRFQKWEWLVPGQTAHIPLSDAMLLPSSERVPEEEVILSGQRTDRPKTFPIAWLQDGKVRTCLDLRLWDEAMQQETYRPAHSTPITALLPFHYHRIPAFLRRILAFVLLRAKRLRQQELYPVSPLNPGGELLRSVCGQTTASPGQPVAVLTHDIDTEHGFSWIGEMARAEEECGFRAAWNVVPKSYPIDRQALRDLKARGHEIGLHGLWHTNREAFTDPATLRKEFTELRPLRNEFGIRGYRGPSWYRTQAMFNVLADFFDYDSSCLDNDFVCPAGGGGVGVTRPFAIRERLIELPCTLPFDAPLLMGRSASELLEFWKPKVRWLRSVGGVLLVNCHPDALFLGNSHGLQAYRTFLAYLRQEGWSWKLPYELAQEYRQGLGSRER